MRTPVDMVAADLVEVAALEGDVQAFPWTLANFTDALRTGYEGWVLRDERGTLEGFCLLMPAPDVMHLLVIAVRPESHRKGIGTALLNWSVARARACHAPGLLLEVRPSNAGALAFYAKHGFLRIGVRRAYYPAPGGLREDAYVMNKPISLDNTPNA